MSRNLACKKSFLEPIRKNLVRVLTFRMVFKMRCKLLSKDLIAEKATKDTVKGFNMELEVWSRAKCLSNLCISLSTKKKTSDIVFKKAEKAKKNSIFAKLATALN